MIPAFRSDGTLPPGIHVCSDWSEIVARFGGTTERRSLLTRLRLGLENLRDAGCPWVLLDGSFVSSKAQPNDVDGCWEYVPSMDLRRLAPAFLLRSRADRETLKSMYGMDFFVAGLIEAGGGRPFSEFFQSDRNGIRKGIVRLDLVNGIVTQP